LTKKVKTGKISKASDTAYLIEFTKKALDPTLNLSLRKSVSKVLNIIVWLLKDRACEPERKEVRIEGYRGGKKITVYISIETSCITGYVPNFVFIFRMH